MKPSPEHDDAHVLMPDWLADAIPALYATEGTRDPLVRVKFFTPDSSWTWYVLEYSPLEQMAYGLVHGHEKELGYFSLAELEGVHGPIGLQVERDLYFEPCPLSTVSGT
jgi:Protein of unknown function (DUF2958)